MLMKRITLVRHAKADWPEATPDFERPLHPQGELDAPDMGQRTRAAGVRPERILTSNARRALSTAEMLRTELADDGNDIPIEQNAELYNADFQTLVDVIRSYHDEVYHLMVVGHNPGMAHLADCLAKDTEVHDLATCTIISLELDIEHWRELDCGTGRLMYYDHPRNPQPPFIRPVH